MKTIHKYQLALTASQDIAMPLGAQILSAQVQPRFGDDTVQVWALVDDHQPHYRQTFYIATTGNEFYVPASARFLGTVQLRGGHFVAHVFEGVVPGTAGSRS